MSQCIPLLSSGTTEGCESVHDALKRFGFRDFRPGQREVIERILEGTVNTSDSHVCWELS